MELDENTEQVGKILAFQARPKKKKRKSKSEQAEIQRLKQVIKTSQNALVSITTEKGVYLKNLKKVQTRLDNLEKGYKRVEKTLEQAQKDLDNLIKKDVVREPVFKRIKGASKYGEESPCLLSSESASEVQVEVPIEK